MSNPLATFRKHRTYWMAGLVLLAILAFVVAPAIEQTMSLMRYSGMRDDIVVRWTGGKITQSDLQYNREQHGRMIRLLYTLAREVIEKGGMPKVPGFSYNAQQKQISLGIPEFNSDLAQCRTRLLAVRAKQLGMEFGNDAVDTYLREFCDKRIPRERFQAILKEQTDNRLTKFDLYEQLKIELAAVVMERLALAGVIHDRNPLLTPGEMWQNYLRLNQSARVEAFPVFPQDQVKNVKQEPTSAEIEELYAQGSQRYPFPGNSTPAFKRRYLANVEYVSANWDLLTEQEKGKISEDKIRAEYDRQISLNQLQVPVETPSTPTSPESTERPPAPPAKNSAESKNEAPNTPPTSPAKASDVPAVPVPTATPKSSQRTKRGAAVVRYVSMLQENSPPPVVQPPQLDAVAPVAAGAIPAGSSPVEPGIPATGAAGAPADAPKMRTQTYEEAKDSIARSLAIEPVRELIRVKLSKIDQAMSKYAGAMSIARLKSSEGVKTEAVAKRPDLKKMAEEEGLTYGQTGKIDGFKLAALPVGMSTVDGRTPVASAIMTPEVPLFTTLRADYLDQAALQSGQAPQFQQFVLWKTEQELAYTPQLSEIRQEVIDAWKLQKAQVLAADEADKLAKKIAAAGAEPWKSVLQPAEQALVINTPLFSWMTTSGGMFGEPVPSRVEGLDTVGPEFMRKVFSTPVGQVGVAPNQGRTVYYVARVVETTPTTEELQQRFQADSFKFAARQLAMGDANEMFGDWYESVENALQVEWLIPAEQLN